MSHLVTRLRRNLLPYPYSRARRDRFASSALEEARQSLRVRGIQTLDERCHHAVYLPGDIYSWIEFEFFLALSSKDDLNQLTRDGTQEALRRQLTSSLVRLMPAVEAPVVAVRFK